MDFVIGGAVAIVVVAAVFGYKKTVIDKFKQIEEEVSDVNELLGEIVGGGE